ncbi:uncharacterized protein TNCV_3100511 [Trichonephila clavipes]|nr:uncharacterized protein TNCV_3100511 [Trichonephila clavipes]
MWEALNPPASAFAAPCLNRVTCWRTALEMSSRVANHLPCIGSLILGMRSKSQALSFSYEVPFNCFMLFSLHKQPNGKPRVVPVSTTIHLVLNLEVSEYHPSHLSRGGQLAIHSPYHVPSPVSEGLFLNMGTVYRVYVRLAEKNLLPPPYKSMCKNYTKLWRENGGEGPVTEKDHRLIKIIQRNENRDNDVLANI